MTTNPEEPVIVPGTSRPIPVDPETNPDTERAPDPTDVQAAD